MKNKTLETCNKCGNAQAQEGSKYCKRCNDKKNKSKASNTILNKFGFTIS